MGLPSKRGCNQEYSEGKIQNCGSPVASQEVQDCEERTGDGVANVNMRGEVLTNDGILSQTRSKSRHSRTTDRLPDCSVIPSYM